MLETQELPNIDAISVDYLTERENYRTLGNLLVEGDITSSHVWVAGDLIVNGSITPTSKVTAPLSAQSYKIFLWCLYKTSFITNR